MTARKHVRPAPVSLLLAATLGLSAAQTARADEAAASANTDASTTVDSKWKIGVGPGVVITPRYPGSRQLSYIPFPALDISYDDRFFSQGPDVLGVNVLRGPAYHLGAALSFDFQSRKESDDPRLHGLGDVDGGPKLKLFADYTWWAFTGSVALYQDIAGHHQGTAPTCWRRHQRTAGCFQWVQVLRGRMARIRGPSSAYRNSKALRRDCPRTTRAPACGTFI